MIPILPILPCLGDPYSIYNIKINNLLGDTIGSPYLFMVTQMTKW